MRAQTLCNVTMYQYIFIATIKHMQIYVIWSGTSDSAS